MSFQRLSDPTRSHPGEKLTIAPMQKATIQIHLSRSTVIVVVDVVKDGEMLLWKQCATGDFWDPLLYCVRSLSLDNCESKQGVLHPLYTHLTWPDW